MNASQTTMLPSTAKSASDKSVDYLKTLYAERFGSELPVEAYEGRSQAHVSGAITRLLREKGRVPATVEDQARVVELGKQLGMTIVPGKTVDVTNRQLRELETKVRAAEYRKGASDFDAFLTSIAPAAKAKATPTKRVRSAS